MIFINIFIFITVLTFIFLLFFKKSIFDKYITNWILDVRFARYILGIYSFMIILFLITLFFTDNEMLLTFSVIPIIILLIELIFKKNILIPTSLLFTPILVFGLFTCCFNESLTHLIYALLSMFAIIYQLSYMTYVGTSIPKSSLVNSKIILLLYSATIYSIRNFTNETIFSIHNPLKILDTIFNISEMNNMNYALLIIFVSFISLIFTFRLFNKYYVEPTSEIVYY